MIVIDFVGMILDLFIGGLGDGVGVMGVVVIIVGFGVEVVVVLVIISVVVILKVGFVDGMIIVLVG